METRTRECVHCGTVEDGGGFNTEDLQGKWVFFCIANDECLAASTALDVAKREALQEEYRAAGKCYYNNPWSGPCGARATESELCVSHTGVECGRGGCNEQATADTGSWSSAPYELCNTDRS